MAKKQEVNTTWTQQDVDLMMWQFAMGMLQATNGMCSKLSELTKDQMLAFAHKELNEIMENRFTSLSKSFNKAPSFKVVFEIESAADAAFKIKKVMQ